MNSLIHNNLHATQNEALRDPISVVSSSFADAGIAEESMNSKITGEFNSLLEQLSITLIVTREYENFVVALHSEEGRVRQSFFPLPHPSGIVVDRKKDVVYICATRNPNQIVEFMPVTGYFERIENKSNPDGLGYLVPCRIKYYPGCYYFHDLALIQRELYANSVGMNCIVRVDFSNADKDKPVWWPKCIEDREGVPNTKANFIQLNSIAAGDSISKSFFTASGEKIGRVRPGHLNYPVDKKGVLFSGKTREVVASGLTRPHSAKLFDNKIWLDNSGYGEFGYVDKEKFIPICKLPGWTRGLCIVKGIAFIGVSKVIPRFKHYAPGIKEEKQVCAVYAVSIKTGRIIGSIEWPYGNQIFGIDFVDKKKSNGFIYKEVRSSSEKEKSVFYKYCN